ncbi:tetratricopeptide repeat protein [uncultured Draconibacterium sp.]|uniref:type IX secretion system periplasmic lipoprotein PorW/SprE n=1 Tax=uncultured Draconibacterium sp. TaxID=1573823 RepID=UPI0025CDCB71|nr:tetratricopeptide repeat protein [uncultured Draconibacterium sp.]
MRQRILHTIFLFLLVSVFAGCSTEKNTRASRTFHNVTSRYNIYFNANEAVKEGVATIEERIEDDFTRVLPIYKESDPSTIRMVKSDMDYAVVKCSKLVEIHSITKKPKRKRGGGSRKYQEFASQEEFNKWIDESYLLMGKAYFYQHNYFAAIDNFSYVVRKYPDEETADEAQVWLIRSFTELERFIEANEVIQAIQAYDDFPKSLERDFAIATAYYHMKQLEYNNAIRMLDIAIKKTFWKKDKARLQYIVAQLYQELGQNEAASAAFKAVTKMNPDYAMAFNARINAAGVFSGEGNTADLRKQLNKMLRDKKNVDFRDQIYYALGNIDFREGDRDGAKGNYKESVATSFKNQFQRALSAITLADIYFEDLNYRGAQSYYDSAMIIIDETYPDYKNVSARYKSLTNLVDNMLTVEREDSLQRVANMPDAEREALIASLMKEEQERQRNMENVAMQGARSQGYYRSNRYRMGMGNSGGAGWYFYNPQTVTYGRVTFQQQWGRRTLEDDWRRSNKNTVSMEEGEELADGAEPEEQRVEDPLKKEFYTQDLPLTDSLMEVSHERIRDALYNAGKIFKSEFEDYKRSAEAFEELIKRYPNNMYLLSAYFDLYDLYELMGDKTQSDYYRNLIISNFPNSKFAQYLINPNFFIEMEAKLDSLNRMYQETFRNYKLGRYQNVQSLTGQMKRMEPDSVILPKIDFMQTVANGVQTGVHNFETLLKDYLAQYPDKEPSPLAQEILTLIQDSTLTDYQKLVEMGYINEEIQNEELLPENFMADDEFGGKFSYEEDLLHYFVIAYPREDESKIDLNRLKFDIANYNIDHYTKIDYDIETEYLDDKLAFVLVRAMTNKENALIYHGAIIRRASVFKTLQGVEYMNFVISSTNYRAVKEERSTADYMKFFVKNYSRFIRSNFSDDEMDISPEELMARAEAEDNALKERGTFVTVKAGVKGLFDTDVDTTQNFIIAVKDKGLAMRPLLRGFADFNRDQFRSWNLALQLKEVGDYQLLVVKGIPTINESMSYFRRVVTTRSLFEPLGQSTYRNFLITDDNLQTLLDENKVDEYITFFRNNYIQRRPASTSTTTGNAGSTNASTTTAGSVQTEEVENREVPEGPYQPEIEGAHRIVFVIPATGVDKATFVGGIQQFNQSNFASSNFVIEEQGLDAIRQLVIIKGMEDRDTAQRYFDIVKQTRSLYAPLGSAQYRNFLISDENFSIFLQEKNITEYMDFYKKVYLNK